MLLIRWAVLFLLMAAVACFVAYMATGQARFRRWGLVTLAWTIVAGLAFFAVLIVERLA